MTHGIDQSDAPHCLDARTIGAYRPGGQKRLDLPCHSVDPPLGTGESQIETMRMSASSTIVMEKAVIKHLNGELLRR